MKSLKPVFLTIVLTCVSFATVSLATAQNTWIGGTPGAETDWNQARNWSRQHVPDWTDEVVIIPDVSSRSGHAPVIDGDVPPVPSMQINAGATLFISAGGRLTIDGETTYNFGLLLYGHLHNAGQMTIQSTALAPLVEHGTVIDNDGLVIILTQETYSSATCTADCHQ